MRNAAQEYAFDGLSRTSYSERWTTNLGMILVGLASAYIYLHIHAYIRYTYCCTNVEKIDVSINALNRTDWNPTSDPSGLKNVNPMNNDDAVASIILAHT